MMHAFHPELTAAMKVMLDKLHQNITGSGYSGEPVQMYLAGGMAVHYYCGTRYTNDVDASFSKRLLLSGKDLTVSYTRDDGRLASIYLDLNYNDTFALMHPDYQQDAQEWEGIGNETRAIQLRVLTPVDLAVSKIARYSQQDQDDILALARTCKVTASSLRQRATEALDFYVGDTRWIHQSLDMISAEIDSL